MPSMGDRVRSEREALGLNYRELADRTRAIAKAENFDDKIAYQSIQALERNEVRTPKYLRYLAAALMVNEGWLRTGRGQKNPDPKDDIVTPSPSEDVQFADSSVEGELSMPEQKTELLEFFEHLSPAGRERALKEVKSVFADEARKAFKNPTVKRA